MSNYVTELSEAPCPIDRALAASYHAQGGRLVRALWATPPSAEEVQLLDNQLKESHVPDAGNP